MESTALASKTNINPIAKLLLCLVLPISVGGFSAYLTNGEASGEWFRTLLKPSFNPPAFLFGPVWTTLYILMGIGVFLVWNTPKTALRQHALLIFVVQLFLNFWWSILFFKMHLTFVAIIDILLMWIMIAYMIVLFKKIKPIAGYLQVPYLLWVSFATALNISLWYLNK